MLAIRCSDHSTGPMQDLVAALFIMLGIAMAVGAGNHQVRDTGTAKAGRGGEREGERSTHSGLRTR